MHNADRNFIVQRIRTQYTEQEHTQLDVLKALDTKVKRPVQVFGWTFGSLGALVMGAGMSLVMTDVGAILGLSATMMPGILVGIAGMAMVLVNYPICKGILSARRKKYAPQIIALSDSLIAE